MAGLGFFFAVARSGLAVTCDWVAGFVDTLAIIGFCLTSAVNRAFVLALVPCFTTGFFQVAAFASRTGPALVFGLPIFVTRAAGFTPAATATRVAVVESG